MRPARCVVELYWDLPAAGPDSASEAELTGRLRGPGASNSPSPAAAGRAGGCFPVRRFGLSLVVALARRLHPAPVCTFSVSFGAGFANELPFSSLVANHCGTDHGVVELTPAAVLHYLDDSIGLLSDPIGDPLTVPNALLFREAAASVGVVLNGEGGDPCFGGPKNLPMLLTALYPNRAGPEAGYLRAHLKCYDDLPDLLNEELRDALADAPLEADVAAPLADSRQAGHRVAVAGDSTFVSRAAITFCPRSTL